MVVTAEGYLAIAYALSGPAAWALVVFTGLKGRKRLAIRPTPVPALDAPPAVSLIIPCRNEEAGIEACVRSALGQDYPNQQTIVVDDRSDDATGRLVDELAAADVRLLALHVRPGETPAGWFGKPFALTRGVKEATGEWLVFVDSDCTLAPNTVREAIATGVTRGFDLVSFVPRFIGTRFWDKLLTPLAGMATSGMYSIIWANARDRPQTAFACGQFIAVRRDAYEKIGGHAALRASAGEDVLMAKKLKAAGGSPRLGWGMDLVTTRMYGTLGSVFTGWGRNFIAASAGKPWRVLAAIGFLLCCTFTVWPALIAGFNNDQNFDAGVWLTLAGLHLTLVTFAIVDAYRWGRADWRYALLWPIGLVVLLAIFVRSLYLCACRRVVWRGVTYELSKAQA
ncbi:MAG: glycosyltransferase family 2 protein [Tepidisphaeraceae bacterium]